MFYFTRSRSRIKKFPEPPQNRTAPKPCLNGMIIRIESRLEVHKHAAHSMATFVHKDDCHFLSPLLLAIRLTDLFPMARTFWTGSKAAAVGLKGKPCRPIGQLPPSHSGRHADQRSNSIQQLPLSHSGLNKRDAMQTNSIQQLPLSHSGLNWLKGSTMG